jgi:lysophospholipase L1-like esterase
MTMAPRFRSRVLVAGLAVLAFGSSIARAADPIPPLPSRCEVSPDLMPDSGPFPHARAEMDKDHRLKIVALGSSSTLGLGASNSQAAWPARLQAVLAARLSGTDVRVVNRGLARQTAAQMVERIDSDVLSEKPSLVIWETGTAEAVRGTALDEFSDALLTGVDRLSAAGIDVILMDTQYSRSTAEIINFEPYVAAIDQVAAMRDVDRFPRYAIMRYWVDNDRFQFAGMSGGAAKKMADQVYDCLGHLLATDIIHGLNAERN